MMSDQTDFSLKHFYIYNDSFGNIEGEEEQKIMYYFPPKVIIDEKMKNVGLSEAIIKFTETFNSEQSCKCLHTEKTRHYYYKPEPDFYIVMVVNVPAETSIEGTRYLGEEVQDSVCLAVVRQAYLMYRLFHNTLTHTLDTSNSRDTTRLKQKLELFFNTYLTSVNLQNCDIMDVFQGVKFLPLDKQTFLHVQCFVNLLEASFPIIEFTSFVYKDSLIWSGLEPQDMQVVYHYLVRNLLSRDTDSEVYNGSLQTSLISSYGSFLTGPKDVHCSSISVGKVPRVFLSQAKPLPEMYHLVVYRLGDCVVCLFIPESEQLTMEMFRKWDTFLGHRLTKLAPEVSAFTNSQSNFSTSSAEPVNRFVYFNQMNLASKSTIHSSSRRGSVVSVSPQVLRILADINAQHTRLSEAGSSSIETILKTTTDHWVVGKLSNAREFYVVVQQKNANLIEINDEVKRISESELKNIFFHI